MFLENVSATLGGSKHNFNKIELFSFEQKFFLLYDVPEVIQFSSSKCFLSKKKRQIHFGNIFIHTLHLHIEQVMPFRIDWVNAGQVYWDN